MIKKIKKTAVLSLSIISTLQMFIPETVFAFFRWIPCVFALNYKRISKSTADTVNILISRIVLFVVIWLGIIIIYSIYLNCRKKVIIKNSSYKIQIEYGDIFKTDNCKRVINFDECFTTKVGSAPEDINPKSVCGQYLHMNPELNIAELIHAANVKPAKKKSKYCGNIRYKSGTIVPNGDDLLLAFARLDKVGKGRFFSRDEYLECLSLLWKEIENHYGEKDVCITVLGSGTTSFNGGSGNPIPAQELLNTIIRSYILSSHKIKLPQKLRIICRRGDEISLKDIEI